MSECKIHTGNLDLDTMLPIDRKGNFIHYGYRLCSKNDCVNPEHITTNIKKARAKGLRPKPLFHKRHDISGEELHKLAKNLEHGSDWHGKICPVPYCTNEIRALNLCNGHHLKYTRWRKANGITRKRMSLDPTPVLEAALPFIGVNNFRPKDRYCHVAGCDGDYMARGLCKKHHHQFLRAIKRGELNGSNG